MKSMLLKTIPLCAVLLAFSMISISHADDWPNFRGPKFNDISGETGLLKSWPKGGPKKLWTSDINGLGYGGISIVDGRLYTMGLEGSDEFGICLDAKTGKKIWQTNIGERYKNGWGDGPRSTPSVDGKHVYMMAARGNLVCMSLASGDKVWSINMSKFGGRIPRWGFSESPLVDGNKVICTPGGDATVVAVDKLTGKTIWKSEAISTERKGRKVTANAHYSSVLPIVHGGKKQYVQLTPIAVIGLDRETGKTLWQAPFPGRVAVIPSPIYKDGNIFVSAGYGAGSKMIKLDSSNKASDGWKASSLSNHHGGVVQVGDHYFGTSDRAMICLNAKDGKPAWQTRKIKKGAISYADGMFYHVQESDGKVFLFKADGDSVKVTGSFVMSPQTERRSPRGKIWVHPVIANGKLYVRDQEYIHCYDIKKQ